MTRGRIGVVIQGESGIGKSEAVLGLLERGHSLVCDDIVCLTLADGKEYVKTALAKGLDVDDFAGRMEIVGKPGEIPPVQQEVQAAIDAAEGRHRPMVSIERFAFYDMARQAYAVIQTGDFVFFHAFCSQHDDRDIRLLAHTSTYVETVYVWKANIKDHHVIIHGINRCPACRHVLHSVPACAQSLL